MTPNATPLRTLSVGGAAYDLFVRVEPTVTEKNGHEVIELPVGSKVQINDVHETCGGGAANTSTGLQRLGLSARFCGIVGSDKWGERMLETLRAEGIDTTGATMIDDEMTGFSVILLLPNGERTILHHAGTNSHLHDVTFDRDALKMVDAVYLNRLSDDACVIQDDIVGMLINRPQLHLTWNPGGCQITEGMRHKDAAALLKVTNLLLLNKEEAMTFTGASDIRSALKMLIDAGAQHVIITDGKEGAYGAEHTGITHMGSRTDITPIDTTGAGDAFGSAATWALLTGHPLPFALKAGTLNAASVVCAIGAQAGLLTDTEINLALRDISLPETHHPW